MVGLGVPRRLFRRHVRRRAERGSGDGERGGEGLVAARGADRLGDAEVRDRRAPRREQHVVGLDVAMGDTVLVRIGERACDVAEDPHGLTDAHRPLTEPLAQRIAVHVRHREPGESVRVPRGEHGDDMRVLELRSEEDLAAEALDGDPREEFGCEHLDDDAAVERALARQIRARHPATAQLTFEDVLVAERLFEAGSQVFHAVRILGSAEYAPEVAGGPAQPRWVSRRARPSMTRASPPREAPSASRSAPQATSGIPRTPRAGSTR